MTIDGFPQPVNDPDLLDVKLRSMLRTLVSVDWSPLGEQAEINIVKMQRLLSELVGIQS